MSCADSSRRGGTESHLWITDVESISSFTAGSSHDYSAVALSGSATFRKYEIEHFTMSLSSTGTKENGSSVITHEVEFTIPKMSKESLMGLDFSFPRLKTEKFLALSGVPQFSRIVLRKDMSHLQLL